MINKIKEFYDKNNYIPTEKDFNNVQNYINIFGSWKKAIKNTLVIYFPNQTMCVKCRKVYPATLEYFNADNKKKNGLHTYCKNCRNKERKNRYIEEKEYLKSKYQENKLYQIKFNIRKRGYPDITEGLLCLIIDNFKNKKGISICPYCGREMTESDMIHFDHFISYSKNIKNLPMSNIIPVCRYCNRSKNDEEFSYWYHYQFFYNSIREQELINYVKNGELVPFYKLN